VKTETTTTNLVAPVGMHDVLYPHSVRWEQVIATFANLVERAGFGLVISPLLEDIAVFNRGIGSESDVVRKEMYELSDRGGRHLALRPEGTASIVRAFVQHRPNIVWKAWYLTPAFRYERPQAGRYRQHHQLGVELLGTHDPEADIEIISLAGSFYRSLGIKKVKLSINSMGDSQCRPSYIELLKNLLSERKEQLCKEHEHRVELNPLRILDCKREECIQATADLPHLIDHLCSDCASHFATVQEGLADLGFEAEVNHRLVRGLDYYTRTTFEFSALMLQSAQNAIGGGGRYDGLVEALGGPPTPGIGFGIGIERLLLAADEEGVLPLPESSTDVFVIDIVGGHRARTLVHELRTHGIRAIRSFDNRSLKAQLKLANRSGARFALIVGPDEDRAEAVTIKALREDESQVSIKASLVTDYMKGLLG